MANNGVAYIIEDNLEFLEFLEDLQKQYLEHTAKAGAKDNVKK